VPALQVPSCSSICMHRFRSESSTWFNVHIKAKRSKLYREYVNGRSVTWPHRVRVTIIFRIWKQKPKNCVESIVRNICIFWVFVTTSKVASSKKQKPLDTSPHPVYLPYKVHCCNAPKVDWWIHHFPVVSSQKMFSDTL
jgi:hypothetical protein